MTAALDPGFWSGRRVLVTGHTGFKGSWLSLWLQRLGAQPAGFSDGVPTDPALFDVAHIGDGMADERGDVRDLERLLEVLGTHRPEIVLHLAAQPIVRAGFEDPLGTFATNVMGTANLLEAVRRTGTARVVVNVTTDKVYENREWEWPYRENEPLGGHDPYAASKACSEIVTSAFRRSFFVPDGTCAVASARAGNVIGGGDWARDRLVPDLVRGALEDRPVPIRNAGAIRPWQHVLNPLLGYLLLAQRLWSEPELAQGWNFGPDAADDLPVREVADRLCAAWGPGLRWEGDRGGHTHEAGLLRLDSSLARARLGWAPRWGLDEALQSIVAFARGHAAGEDARALMDGQLAAFEAGAPPPRALPGATPGG